MHCPRFSPHVFSSLFLFLLLGPAQAVDFVHEVMPILKEHCAKCHTDGEKKGGLAMNTRAELLAGGENGPIVVPGNAAASLLLELTASTDDDEWMPPKGPRVPAAQLAVLRKWIDQGLAWEPGITLGSSGWEPPLKPRKVSLPAAQAGRAHPIDRILDAELVARKQSLPEQATDAAFIRRASLDIIGLLPTPSELEAFLADSSPDKHDTLIDRLLADDIGYADHWLTTWNDLLRNDYTGTGFITKGRTQITTWLYAALRDNKPYDEMVRELISPQPEAAGFINGIKWRGEVNSSQTRDIQFAQNVSQVFLGINMKCASCHDSFVDRWTLSEAYNLAAIFAEKPLELNRCDKPIGKMATPKWLFPELGDVDPKAAKPERLKQLAGLMTHPDNGRFTRTLVNRIWHRLMGRGIVHPVDAMHTQPWNEDLLDHLAVQFAADGHDLRGFMRYVMSSQAYQSKAVVLEKEPGEDYVYAGPIAKRMTAEQFMDTIWQVTGAHPASANAKVDRTPRAEPVAAPANPLPPQPITASWIWHEGEVGTKSKLRYTLTLDSAPSAARLIATCDNAFVMRINGMAVASSKDWQQPVVADLTASLQAGDNHIEVDAEMFGGAAGFVAQLSLREGDAIRVINTDAAWQARPPTGEWKPAALLHAHGAGPWKDILKPDAAFTAALAGSPPVRAGLVNNDFLMRSLGRPHRDQVVSTRPSELTTLQAIDLANGAALAGYLSKGAKRLMREKHAVETLPDWLFRFAYARDPGPGERPLLGEVIGDGTDPVAMEDLLWLVFMQPEFQLIR